MTHRPLYSEYAWAYDLIVQKPVAKWCDFIHKTLMDFGVQQSGYILDAGCGTGEYALILSQKGYRVSGIDMSSFMVAQAEEKAKQYGADIHFIVGDFLTLPKKRRFDVVLCRGVLNDLTEDVKRQKAFDTFSDILNDKGLLMLDVRDWDNSVKEKRQHPLFEKKVITPNGELTFTSETKLDLEKHLLLIRETFEDQQEGEFNSVENNVIMRCWTTDELTDRLKRAGFSVIHLYGDYDEKVPIGTTDRIIAIAQLS